LHRTTPAERVLPWAEKSYQEFRVLAQDPNTGVLSVPVVHYYRGELPDPWWCGSVIDLKTLGAEDLSGPYACGYRYGTYVAESPRYMPYLRKRLETLGGVIRQDTVKSFLELKTRFNVVVNCAGVWAGELAGDRSVYPIRGQVLRVKRPEGLMPCVIDGEGVFVVCRTNDCIIGGANTDGDWSLAPREEDRDYLLDAVGSICAELVKPDIIEERVGLRPGRESVRLDVERVDNLLVIHNYGHGGAGYTLSWGCADEVVKLISEQ
jgi:D-amino-acid oxidase